MIVLAVDDSDVNLSVYRSVLGRVDGIDVVSRTAASEALRWAKEYTADIAIVDYHMPEMDGLEFVRRYREVQHDPEALVVMITSDEEREVRHRALDAGVNDFLIKPIDRVEFTARIRNLLALAASRRQLRDRAGQMRAEIDRATSSLALREIETIIRLTRAAEFRDDVTAMHVIRVGHMCCALARQIGLPDDEARMLLLAAPMHDIGKVATPDDILRKPGPLTPAEFEIMKQHTIAGHEILKDSASPMLRCAAEIAWTHHERFDGSGYPRGIAGRDIPLAGRLCSVVDVFDALTSARPYKRAWEIDEAVAEIDTMSGTHFDPEIVQVFHDAFDTILDIKRRFTDGPADVASIRDALLI